MRADALIGRVALVVTFAMGAGLAATSAAVLWPKLAPAAPASASVTKRAPAYAAGDRFDGPAAWYEDTPVTLVIFAQAACGACQRAEPFLRALVQDVRDRAAIVVAGPGLQPDADAGFARALGVRPDRVHLMPAGLRAMVTPTLVLVDRQGSVLGAWEGVGPEEEHPALRLAIEQLTVAR